MSYESLHDAELVTLTIDRDNWKVLLDFRLENGRASSMKLEGVVALRVDDLTLQNVVSRVLRSTRNHFSKERIDYWLTWLTSSSDSRSWLKDEHKSELIADCERGVVELIVFEPSAGAQIAAACKSVTLT